MHSQRKNELVRAEEEVSKSKSKYSFTEDSEKPAPLATDRQKKESFPRMSSVVPYTCHPEFEASLGYTVRPYLNKNKNKGYPSVYQRA